MSDHGFSPSHQPHYGSISFVKNLKHQMHTPTHNHMHQTNLTECECATLSTNLSFLKGGRMFRSRDRISRFLDHSTFGIALDAFLAIISLVNVSTYILITYTKHEDFSIGLWLMEILCALLFAIDYLFRGLYLADRRLEYFFSLAGLVNLLVILPILPTTFYISYQTLWYGPNLYWRFLYPFRFIKCYFECHAVLSRCHAYMTPVRQFAVLCYIQIILIIAFAAGVLQIAETADGNTDHRYTYEGDWTFFNAFFNSVLVFVTIQTPTADNVLAKCFIGILVIVLILIVPYQIGRVLDLGKSFSSYELDTFIPSHRTKHIILCGDLTSTRIDHFFHEVFHDDHDVVDIHVVVVSDQEPSTTMIALLMDPFFEKRTRYIQGTILDVDDAERAALGQADAIFILTQNCQQEEYMTSDHHTLMRVLAAKRMAPEATIYAQLHLSSNRYLMEDLDIKNVLYFSEVMHSLLGQNCICPGFSTFIYNLTSTSSDGDKQDGTDHGWEGRYIHGSNHEVYSVELPSNHVIGNKSFAEVASLVYSECDGVILFAILESIQDKIMLNPGDTYTCVGCETAFVIAKNRRDADMVTCMKITSKSAWGSQKEITTSLLAPMSPNKYIRRQSLLQNWNTTLEACVHTSSEREEKTKEQSSVHTQLFRHRKIELEDVVIDDVGNLSLSMPHIVICIVSTTSFPYHLEYLMGPLRVKALHHHRPVIIVTHTLPTSDQYDTFRHFKAVYFVQGSPFQRKTLQRGGIETAHRVVIMGDEGESDAESTSAELLADASCIALHKTIISMIGPQRAPRVITELVNRANVHYITQNLIPSEWFSLSTDDGIETNDSHASTIHDPEMAMIQTTNMIHRNDRVSSQISAYYKYSAPVAHTSTAFTREFCVSPAFASGLTYSTSLCDSLMINQYFNPMIKRILREFIFASWKDEDYMTMPKTPPSIHSPIESMNPSVYSPSQGGQRSSLFAVEMPLDFVGKTFEYVFHYLLSSDGILTIGIYRCRPDAALNHLNKARVELTDDVRSVPYGFVYVNPFPHDILTGNDLLYVLAHKQPRWA